MTYRWFTEENIKTIPELLKQAAEKMDAQNALFCLGNTVRYRMLYAISQKVASFVRYHSWRGDRAAIFLPNIPQFLFACYGIFIAGRIAIPINFSSLAKDLKTKKPDEITVTPEILEQFRDSKPSLVFVLDRFVPILKQVPIDWHCTIVVTGEMTGKSIFARVFNFCVLFPWKRMIWIPDIFIALYPKTRRTDLASLDDVALFQYTGGTTGIPKAAMLTHRNLSSNMWQVRERFGDALADEQEVVLGALPFFHIYGLTVCMNIALLALRGQLVLIPAFEPRGVIAEMEKYGVTVFPGINRMYESLVGCEELLTARLRLKLCASGAGRIEKSVCDAFCAATGTAVVEGYGLSESLILSVTLPADINRLRDSQGSLVGELVPATYGKIIDDDGNELPAGSIGELIVFGPQVMRGYYQKPEETATTFHNGWFRTGDIMYFGYDGCLYFVDRKKDMLKIGGENVYASHIEAHLAVCPLVLEAYVVGLSQPSGDDMAVACVVVRDTYRALTREQIEREIIAFVKSREQNHKKIPKRVALFESFEPFKNIIGKILKRKLKEHIMQEMEKEKEQTQ